MGITLINLTTHDSPQDCTPLSLLLDTCYSIIINEMVRAANERTQGFYVGCGAWCLCCYWLITNDLGSIAFVGSVILAIFTFGLREKFGSEETSSAYSVFNKGGKGIPGGFTGDQLDRQLRGGAVANNHHKSAATSTARDGNAPLVTTSDQSLPKKRTSDKDKLKRRSAAAAAAERRFQEQQQIM